MIHRGMYTVYTKKYAMLRFVVLCIALESVWFTHVVQGCFVTPRRGIAPNVRLY